MVNREFETGIGGSLASATLDTLGADILGERFLRDWLLICSFSEAWTCSNVWWSDVLLRCDKENNIISHVDKNILSPGPLSNEC